MSRFEAREVVMGIHPTDRGFGWVVFQGPTHLLDWAVVHVRGTNINGDCLAKLEDLVQRFRPETLVLEWIDRKVGKRSPRIQRLARLIEERFSEAGVNVLAYRRRQTHAAMSLDKVATRQQVAEAVACHIDAIRHRLPAPRKPWESADRRMAMFTAAALVLTHFATVD